VSFKSGFESRERERESQFNTADGSEFQVRGAAVRNDRLANDVRRNGTHSSPAWHTDMVCLCPSTVLLNNTGKQSETILIFWGERRRRVKTVRFQRNTIFEHVCHSCMSDYSKVSVHEVQFRHCHKAPP